MDRRDTQDSEEMTTANIRIGPEPTVDTPVPSAKPPKAPTRVWLRVKLPLAEISLSAEGRTVSLRSIDLVYGVALIAGAMYVINNA